MKAVRLKTNNVTTSMSAKHSKASYFCYFIKRSISRGFCRSNNRDISTDPTRKILRNLFPFERLKS